MEALTEFITYLPNFIGVFLLMLSTFLIGYFSAVGMQRNKFRKIIERLKREVNALKMPPKKEVRDIDTIFTEIKPKIIEVVKKQQEIKAEDDAQEVRTATVNFAEKNKERYLQEVTEVEEDFDDLRELDFDSFGYADESDKEDLTEINGIGPYIEQKLNDIGIYTFEQISKLSKKDIDIITEMIDFFPDRIDRDNWVGQAKALNV
ncbi:hypothetical protein G5B37_02485 [Rasiella rasia]|uniref:Uncharacterized protein n=1 Tax=Rasiella rasia TaxID=2744027 RepID=A0A6G6GIU5_9FLAO|nr:hypothetical protein [Rasiella rasia]QIE58468.1 hypothetical protein G5B37_02485 [Rasiella rasia]